MDYYKESWAQKSWCFGTVVLEKTLECPLDCKEIKPVNPKGNNFSSVARSCLTVADPHGLQHARLPRSISNSWGLLKFMSIKSVMTSSHLILCHPLHLLPSILSQHQGLFQWAGFSHWVAKVLELQHQSFQCIFRISFWT